MDNIAKQVSGTEAIELLRQFLGAREHESLQDSARRVIDEYTHRSAAEKHAESELMAERAMIASMLRLDPDDTLMLWQHVFDAVSAVIEHSALGATDREQKHRDEE